MSQTSSDSTSLSDFVRKRYTGAVPVMGGDIRTGAKQFGSAVGGSIKQADVYGTIELLSTQLRNMVGAAAKVQSTGVTNIAMYDNSQEEMSEAFVLDDEKIQLLLSASYVEPKDLARYASLIRATQDGLKKKQVAMQQHNLRKQAKAFHDAALPLRQVPEDPGGYVDAILDKFGHKLCYVENRALFLLALTHESLTNGRETNRVLAHIGDSIAKTMCGMRALHTGVSVAELSDIIQSTQSNVAWRDASLNLGLDKYVRCAPEVDSKGRTLLSTVFEAILGAIFVDGGIPAVMASNFNVHWFDDGQTPTLVSETFVDATEIRLKDTA